MPEMSGLEAVRLIRGLDSEYARTIPIISMTGDDPPEDEKTLLEIGFNGFITKPMNPKKLKSITEEFIRKKGD
jgi:CheY-like chemotaxis protein